MPDRAELTGAGMGHTHVNVGVFTDSQSQIRRHGSYARAVGSHPTPGLSAQELPLAALQIQPVEAQAVGMGIGGVKYVGGVIAVKIHFDVAGNVILAELGMRLQVQARILSGSAELGEVALYG